MIATLLLNQLIEVKTGSFTGDTGITTAIMADGRTLEVKLDSGRVVFLDASFVREVRAGEPVRIKPPRDLGGVGNSVMKDTI